MNVFLHTTVQQELIQQSVRHIAEEGLSYYEAKRKAAKQLGVSEQHSDMPANELIEKALREYLELYVPENALELRRLRQLAHTWLTRLENLSMMPPNERLIAVAVGAVVNGTATQHSPIHLHIFTDHFKLLEIALLNESICLEHTEKKVQQQYYPVIVAQDAGVPIAMTVLPLSEYYSNKTTRTASDTQTASRIHLQQLLNNAAS